MTSMAAEFATTILASCKQTRFHIESPNYRELDIDGLTITVTSGEDCKPTTKGKDRARGNGTEILSNAKLRLKAGQRYALVGRNGSGKSTLLRAIAEKLIPGIPEQTRVAILQQTHTSLDSDERGGPRDAIGPGQSRSVLEEVIDQATARCELEQDINALSAGVNSSDSHGALRALRKLRHEQLQKRLFVLDKNARLRSGARGSHARKALVEHEKTVAESATLMSQQDDEISAEMVQAETQEAADMLAELQVQVEPSRLAEVESRAKTILAGLGFSEACLGKTVSDLSGGWRMRTALAASLLQEADILILDEPTNFLDLLGILWLQRYLESLQDEVADPPTLILVSHDRDFATSICTDLVILQDKALTAFHGSLAAYEAARSERRLYLAKMKEAKDKQKAHMQGTIRQNMASGRKNDDANKMRQAKSRQRKLDERWGLEYSAKGGRFKLNRDLAGYHFAARADIDVPPEDRAVVIAMPDPPDLRFPGPLLSLEGVAFCYPAPKAKAGAKATLSWTLQDITLSVGVGDRVGIVGLNGAGKSALVRLLVGEARPSTGTRITHPRLKLGYYSQEAVSATQALGLTEADLTALSLLLREAGDELKEGEIRGLLSQLGLPGRLASDVPVRKLSGGQLVRLALARLFWKRPHALVLDEVTTHLDYGTVGALREALRDWEGAVVLVSHDRWFVRGVVEGLLDEEEEDEDDSQEDEEGPALRRRSVYAIKGGKLVLLQGGVQDFEQSVQKKVKKLLGA